MWPIWIPAQRSLKNMPIYKPRWLDPEITWRWSDALYIDYEIKYDMTIRIGFKGCISTLPAVFFHAHER